MTKPERAPEPRSLAEIAVPGAEYVVLEEVSVKHMTSRSMIDRLTLQPGDVVKVATNDPQRGLAFRCDRYPQGEVILSPRSAAQIQVELS